MKPAAFDYWAPRTLDEALSLLAEHADAAKPLAGGQSLIPAMNFRLAAPAVLVDLNGIPELSYIREEDDALHIGAMTRQRELERSATVARGAPLLAAALPFVAHTAIRTRGTIGGSIAHADPAAELPAVMLALDAQFTIRSAASTRTVGAPDFCVGLFTTLLAPGELLTEVRVPRARPRTGIAFEEISRRHGDFAMAGAAACVALDDDGRCTSARVALLSVSDRPVLSPRVSRALVGERPTDAVIRAAAEDAAAHDIDPSTDLHASSRYRRQLAAVLTRRVLQRAFQETR